MDRSQKSQADGEVDTVQEDERSSGLWLDIVIVWRLLYHVPIFSCASLHDLQKTLNPDSTGYRQGHYYPQRSTAYGQWPPVKGVRPEKATPTSDQWSPSSPDLLKSGRKSEEKPHQRLDLGREPARLPMPKKPRPITRRSHGSTRTRTRPDREV